MTKITIIHICDKFGVEGSSVHGVSRLFSWWFPRFDYTRFNVHLVGLRQSDSATEKLRDQGLEITTLDKGKFDLSALLDIYELIKNLEPDILHLHGYGASNLGLMAAMAFPALTTIVHEHFVDPNYPLYQKPFDLGLSRFADCGVAICESVKKFMVESRHFSPQQVRVIFNGVPRENFTRCSDQQVAAERRLLAIPADNQVVATVGRLDQQKGNRYFIEAAKILLERGHKVTFLVVGDGPLLAELRQQVASCGIERAVIFTGYRQDIPLIQSLLDVQVFPSLWEGTTLTIFEAFCLAIPVVASKVDGLAEVVREGKNGLLVPPADGFALATAIERLLLDRELAQRLATGARASAEAYDVLTTVRNLEALYEELLQAKPTRREPPQLEEILEESWWMSGLPPRKQEVDEVARGEKNIWSRVKRGGVSFTQPYARGPELFRQLSRPTSLPE